MGKPVITAAEVQQASGGTLIVARDAIVTPLARDVARDRGVDIVREGRRRPPPRRRAVTRWRTRFVRS